MNVSWKTMLKSTTGGQSAGVRNEGLDSARVLFPGEVNDRAHTYIHSHG